MRAETGRCRKQVNGTLASRRGFTLVEMLVVAGVFSVLAGVIIGNFHSVEGTFVLDASAQKVASEIRNAQIHGIAVVGESGGEYPGYGASFTADPPPQKSFVFFKDLSTPVEKIYDGPAELVYTTDLEKNTVIWKVCGNMKTNTEDYLTCTALDSLHISFVRPDPEATLLGISGGSIVGPYSDAEVILRSPSGDVKSVIVWTTGQISVE